MKIVLHICCGGCAAGVVERLTLEGHEVVGLFYNPNIHPLEEYERRLEATYKVARELNFPLEVSPYTPEEWLEEASFLENEPEGGRRCEVCFRLRLKKTYLYLKDCGGDAFTTTLTVSPSKSAAVINQVGQEIGGDRFLVRDFKKKAGFQRATELAKQWAIYRQDYCGCIYSLRQKKASEGLIFDFDGDPDSPFFSGLNKTMVDHHYYNTSTSQKRENPPGRRHNNDFFSEEGSKEKAVGL